MTERLSTYTHEKAFTIWWLGRGRVQFLKSKSKDWMPWHSPGSMLRVQIPGPCPRLVELDPQGPTLGVEALESVNEFSRNLDQPMSVDHSWEYFMGCLAL